MSGYGKSVGFGRNDSPDPASLDFHGSVSNSAGSSNVGSAGGGVPASTPAKPTPKPGYGHLPHGTAQPKLTPYEQSQQKYTGGSEDDGIGSDGMTARSRAVANDERLRQAQEASHVGSNFYNGSTDEQSNAVAQRIQGSQSRGLVDNGPGVPAGVSTPSTSTQIGPNLPDRAPGTDDSKYNQ